MNLSDVLKGIPDRVQAGIAWLNDNKVGWANKIDVDRLDIGSGCDCIGGQLCPNYAWFQDAYGLSYHQASMLGFFGVCSARQILTIDDRRKEYVALTNAWATEIAKLQKGHP